MKQLSPWVGGLWCLLVTFLSPGVMSCFKRCMAMILSLPIVEYQDNTQPIRIQDQLSASCNTLHTDMPPPSLTPPTPECREETLHLKGFCDCNPPLPSRIPVHYGLHVKCPHRLLCLNTSFPVDGCVLGGLWNIRM